MKKLSSFILGVVTFALLFSVTKAAPPSWDILSFDTVINVSEDSILHVTETITADFTKLPSRGIFRTIPTKYYPPNGEIITTYIRVKNITDETNDPYEYRITRENGGINIRVGDPDLYLHDTHTYILTYDVIGVPLAYDDHDEIYWNINGNEWDVAILETSATVILPKNTEKASMQTTCYTGKYGSTESNCTHSASSDTTFQFDSTTALGPYEGMTIVAGFPKGIIHPTPWYTLVKYAIWDFVRDNWGYFVPLLLLIFLSIKWYFVGRDPKAERETIIPHYTAPNNMTAVEVGTVIDDALNTSDISAEIINLAIKGYIKIEEIRKKPDAPSPDDYKFILTKDFINNPDLQDFQIKILRSMFGVAEGKQEKLLSELKFQFFEKIEGIKKLVYAKLIKDNIYTHNPETVRGSYISIALTCLTIAFVGVNFFIGIGATHIFVGLIACAALLAIFARIMPRKTLHGVNMLYEIKGLEEYILTAEKDRIKFQENKGILFEKLLPYAMTLGIADKWAKTFEGIYKQAPNWYEGYYGNTFTTYYFISHLNILSGQINSTIMSQPRSSGRGKGGDSFGGWSGGSGFGGGFSGGGFGGGGGGRW